MLFSVLLCFNGLVTASPTFGPWSRNLNPLSFFSEQLPLHIVSEFAKGTARDEVIFKEKHAEEHTIWEIIKDNSRFTKLTKAIEFADAIKYFDDKDADFTFFATPDWAIPRGEGDCENLANVDQFTDIDDASLVLAQGCHWHDALAAAEQLDAYPLLDDKKKERRKKFLKRLVQAILAYEALPEAIDSFSLGDNQTYATKLAIPGVLAGQPLRVRVEQKLLPPSTSVNFLSKVIYPDVKASNGIIHVVNAPVLPPLAGFQTLFLLPGQFSILTSAIQRVGLTDNVDLRYVERDDGDGYELQGSSALTLFAPTNSAFERLPLKLRLFLFSPFGYCALRKVLEYHVVPDLVVHTDYQYNKSAHANPGNMYSSSYGKVISDAHLELPTLLEDHYINVHVKKYEFNLPVPGPDKPSVVKTEVEVNHHEVLVSDVVTSNAAVHIVDRLLDPRHHHHHHHHHDHRDCYERFCQSDNSWEDWEDWLVDWANST
ncbi:hypothetical protein D9756_001768 [Leucocoprinus leucothites]|uniref:FAS1 domain-containing protein n=1 Tax=Leucocoprinus leucothites TaxID=201217 RepID=A0A8H5G4D0_9AGAR|nr:hypothetical protein D9756_001768 [Leucoagaricus leucothites]